MHRAASGKEETNCTCKYLKNNKKPNLCFSINTFHVCWKSRETVVENCQSHMEKSIHSPKMFISKLQHQFVYHNETLFLYQSSYLYKGAECQKIREDIFYYYYYILYYTTFGVFFLQTCLKDRTKLGVVEPLKLCPFLNSALETSIQNNVRQRSLWCNRCKRKS